MPGLNIAYWHWCANQIIKKIGMLGILALAIALGCCLFYALNIMPLQQQVLADSAKLKQLKQVGVLDSENTIPAPNTASEPTTTEAIHRFYAQFPVGESLPACLGLIDKIATKQRLVLNRGDYKLTPISQLQTKHGAFLRYEIVLPVTGQYTQIRQFVAQVLHELPALALNDMQLQRENAQSPSVEARLIFVLLLNANGSASTWP